MGFRVEQSRPVKNSQPGLKTRPPHLQRPAGSKDYGDRLGLKTQPPQSAGGACNTAHLADGLTNRNWQSASPAATGSRPHQPQLAVSPTNLDVGPGSSDPGRPSLQHF